ncbi:hypothetical protein G956_00274, partial [Escherichia coli UMEA 3264-1]
KATIPADNVKDNSEVTGVAVITLTVTRPDKTTENVTHREG